MTECPSGQQHSTNAVVDFATIKQQVDIERILAHYGLLEDMRQLPNGRLRGHCPFHQDTEPSFTTTPTGRGFHCFGCGVKGNVIAFVRLRERIATGDIAQDEREAARLIQDWFGITPSASHRRSHLPRPVDDKSTSCIETMERPVLQTLSRRTFSMNRPLSFALESLDHKHPYLASRGLSPATIKHFGLGYFPRKGSMSGRIVIPIHNAQGQLVAYAGRWPTDTLPINTPKYKLPKGFHKSLELFNLHRVPQHARRVVLVEGYWSVFHLYQAGFRHVIALMGTSLSERQLTLIRARFQRVQVFLDGDQAGQEASVAVATQVATHLWVKIVVCPDGCQPDDLTPEQLSLLLR